MTLRPRGICRAIALAAVAALGCSGSDDRPRAVPIESGAAPAAPGPPRDAATSAPRAIATH